MSAGEVDQQRRKFLSCATTVLGGVGLACASTPFLSSWLPSAKAQSLGAPVEVDISKLAPGQKITVAWRGQPIFVIRRSPAALADLSKEHDLLRDPDSLESLQPSYAKNPYRSIKQEYLVLVAICTHLGCVPLFKPEPGSVEAAWEGGLFCPCHGSKYDFAGRVYKGVPAPLNLPVPPHHYLNDRILVIGSEAPVEAT